ARSAIRDLREEHPVAFGEEPRDLVVAHAHEVAGGDRELGIPERVRPAGKVESVERGHASEGSQNPAQRTALTPARVVVAATRGCAQGRAAAVRAPAGTSPVLGAPPTPVRRPNRTSHPPSPRPPACGTR